MRRYGLMAAAFLMLLCAAETARADVELGAMATGNFGVGSTDVRLPSSWSIGGLAGYRFKLDILELTPELELTYLNSSKSLTNGNVDWAFQATAGGRAGLALGGWVPSAFVHFGLGDVRFESSDLVRRTKTGPLVEVGGALDYRLARMISIGVQVSYSAVRLSDVAQNVGSGSINWVRAGGHLIVLL